MRTETSTKLIVNSEYDITKYIYRWHIYIQPEGCGLVLITRQSFDDIKDTAIAKFEYIEIHNKYKKLKLTSIKPPIININYDKFAEIWLSGGVLS